MTWGLPDKGAAAIQNDLQAIPFSVEFEALAEGLKGQAFVVSGCAPTQQGSPNMTVAVAAGVVYSNGLRTAYAGGNATITTADATNPRLDLIVLDNTGTLVVRPGTAAAAPKPPARSTDDVVIAMVYIPATDTTITNDQIVDQRVMRSIDWFASALGADVTMTLANTFYDGPSITLPAGTWQINASVSVTKSTTTAWVATGKITDGTTDYVSAFSSQPSLTGSGASIDMQWTVRLTSQKTMKVSVASTTTSCTVKAAAPNNAAGNTATTITAQEILP